MEYLIILITYLYIVVLRNAIYILNIFLYREYSIYHIYTGIYILLYTVTVLNIELRYNTN